MRNLFRVNRFWTFEQIGPRTEQIKKYLKQVNDEMFKQSMIRNVIGTAVSFPIHYFLDPVVSIAILSGTAIVQAHSIYKHRQLTQPLGYTQANKHLLLQELSQSEQMQSNITTTNTITSSNVGGGYKDYLKAQEYKRNADSQGQQSDLSSSQQPLIDKIASSSSQSQSIEYIQVETNEQRLKYYNRQLLCVGLLQGIFLGSYTELWEGDGDTVTGESGSILLLHLSIFMNSMLSGKLFSELYSQKYLNLTSSKAFMLGSFLPLPLTLISPLLFNNGFLQSNLSKNAQMLFLKENITEDPASFLMKRTGMRLFALIMMYLMALANLEDKRNPQENKTFTISFITKRPKSGNDGDDDSEDN